MKNRLVIALALLIAALLAVSALADADVELGADGLAGKTPVDMELPGADDPDVDLVDGGAEGTPVDDVLSGDLLALDGGDNVVVYCFTVNGEVYAIQEARDGDIVLQPEDPAAPEGMTFVGWALEKDGTPLFVDADADGQTEPVIARAESLYSEVNVLAVFEEAPTGEKAPAEEGAPTEEGVPAEEGAPAEAASIPQSQPVANNLVYTGEPQPLVSAEDAWHYSLDGESYTGEIPAAVDAGEYTVYYRAVDDPNAEVFTLTVTVAKADVTFEPPVAATGEE